MKLRFPQDTPESADVDECNRVYVWSEPIRRWRLEEAHQLVVGEQWWPCGPQSPACPADWPSTTQRMRIVSDGEGQGTVIYVGDAVLDGVHSLNIAFPNRQSKATITMTIDADVFVFAVVERGEVELLHEGMRPNLPDRSENEDAS